MGHLFMLLRVFLETVYRYVFPTIHLPIIVLLQMTHFQMFIHCDICIITYDRALYSLTLPDTLNSAEYRMLDK